MTPMLLSVNRVSKAYRSGGRHVVALDDVCLDLAAGETVGLVGASGSGKSTLARVIARLTPADAGSVTFEGRDWLGLSGRALRLARPRLQMVFQDPLAAFNPLATVGGVLADPLRIHAVVDPADRPREVARLLERVDLPTDFAGRSILDISGGQRQRVAIARALATRPSLIVLDEAVSALDVSVRRTILDLLVDLQRERGISYLFVSHDLAVVRAVAHRVAVLDAGTVVETGAATDVVAHPQSAAAQALVAAVPQLIIPSS